MDNVMGTASSKQNGQVANKVVTRQEVTGQVAPRQEVTGQVGSTQVGPRQPEPGYKVEPAQTQLQGAPAKNSGSFFNFFKSKPPVAAQTIGGSRKKKMKRVKRNKTNKYKKYKK